MRTLPLHYPFVANTFYASVPENFEEDPDFRAFRRNILYSSLWDRLMRHITRPYRLQRNHFKQLIAFFQVHTFTHTSTDIEPMHWIEPTHWNAFARWLDEKPHTDRKKYLREGLLKLEVLAFLLYQAQDKSRKTAIRLGLHQILLQSTACVEGGLDGLACNYNLFVSGPTTAILKNIRQNSIRKILSSHDFNDNIHAITSHTWVDMEDFALTVDYAREDRYATAPHAYTPPDKSTFLVSLNQQCNLRYMLQECIEHLDLASTFTRLQELGCVALDANLRALFGGDDHSVGFWAYEEDGITPRLFTRTQLETCILPDWVACQLHARGQLANPQEIPLPQGTLYAYYTSRNNHFFTTAWIINDGTLHPLSAYMLLPDVTPQQVQEIVSYLALHSPDENLQRLSPLQAAIKLNLSSSIQQKVDPIEPEYFERRIAAHLKRNILPWDALVKQITHSSPFDLPLLHAFFEVGAWNCLNTRHNDLYMTTHHILKIAYECKYITTNEAQLKILDQIHNHLPLTLEMLQFHTVIGLPFEKISYTVWFNILNSGSSPSDTIAMLTYYNQNHCALLKAITDVKLFWRTTFHYAACQQDTSVLEFLLNIMPKPQISTWTQASYKHETRVFFEVLMQYGTSTVLSYLIEQDYFPEGEATHKFASDWLRAELPLAHNVYQAIDWQIISALLTLGATGPEQYLFTLLEDAVRKTKPSLVPQLLKQCASNNVNFRDHQGRTALHLAIQWGKADLVDALLANPTLDINLPDAEGNTPVHLIMRHMDDHSHGMDMLQKLYQKGALLHTANHQGELPAHRLRYTEFTLRPGQPVLHAVQYLQEKGAFSLSEAQIPPLQTLSHAGLHPAVRITAEHMLLEAGIPNRRLRLFGTVADRTHGDQWEHTLNLS